MLREHLMNHETMRRRGFVPYGPSRAGAESLSIIMAEDLRPYGIAVSILLPGGATDTGMIPDGMSVRRSLLPAQVMGPPAVFLASPEVEGVTGERIVAKDFDAWLDRGMLLVRVSPRQKPLIYGRPTSGSGCSSRKTKSYAGPRPTCHRRTCREKALPARERASPPTGFRGGVVPVLKLSRQPYYRWLADPVTRFELNWAHRANALFDAHRDDPEFGYRLPRRRSSAGRRIDV